MKTEKSIFRKDKAITKNKYVIYTVIVAGYDTIKQPLVIDDRFDYVFFTDEVRETQIGVWQVRPIPYRDENKMRLSRYAKCLPTTVLPDYEASLYIDGTLQIAESWVYERFIELVEQENVDWAGVNHFHRDCIYDEMCGIVGEFPKGVHDYETIRWYCKLKKEGFPPHFGLYENNLILRRHCQAVEYVDEQWWETLKKSCKRDQFSLMYLLWKYPLKKEFFLDKSIDTKHTDKFIYSIHSVPRKNIIMNFHEKVRRRCWISKYGSWWYGYVMEEASKFPFPKYCLYEWELFAIFKYWLPAMVRIILKKALIR